MCILRIAYLLPGLQQCFICLVFVLRPGDGYVSKYFMARISLYELSVSSSVLPSFNLSQNRNLKPYDLCQWPFFLS